MIVMFDKNETKFGSNGLAVIDNDIRGEPVVNELFNGLYSLEFKYSKSGEHLELIDNDMIVKAPTPDGDQPFRIYKVVKQMGYYDVSAYHIFYNLAGNFIEDSNIVDSNGMNAIKHIGTGLQYPTSFEFTSDIAANNSARIVRMNAVQALLDTETDNSFINRWGGEIKRDGDTISMNKARGTDRGFKVKYRKNLTGFEATFDRTNVVTRIMPYGYNGLMLPEKYVDSPHINDYPIIYIKKFDYNDIKAIDPDADSNDENAVPLEQAYELLRQAAQREYDDNKVDIPTSNFKITMKELSDTRQYSSFKAIEKLSPWDYVSIDTDVFSIKSRMISYKYNPKTKHYIEVELGNYIPSFSDVTSKTDSQINEIQNNIDQLNNDVLGIATAPNGNHTIWADRAPTADDKGKDGDVWYYQNGDLVEMWVYDGTTTPPQWRQKITDLTGQEIEDKVDQAQEDATKALNDANTAVENSNKAVSDAGFATDIANDAKASAADATGKAAEAVSKAEGAQVNADTAVKNSNNALTDAANAIKTANDSSSKATQAQQDANNATAKAEDAISSANKAQGDATNAINNAQDALDKYNNLEIGDRNLILDSQFNQSSKYWNGQLSTDKYNDSNILDVKSTTTWYKLAQYISANRRPVSVKVGDSFVIRYKIKVVGTSTDQELVTTVIEEYDSLTTPRTQYQGIAIVDGTIGDWQTITGIYTVKGSTTKYISFVPQFPKAGGEVLFTEPEMYQANKLPANYSPAPEDIQVQITNINGELSQKVSQTEYNNLKGTVENNSTQITQNQHDIQLKANQTQVDTINKTVQNQQTEINQNASQIELKADKTVTDQINKDVASNSANIKLNSDQIKLKADSSTVNSLSGRVTDAEGKLTVQADKIAQTVSKTELDNTLGKYATQTWTQGQITTASDEIELSVKEVQSNIDSLSVGGRNYILGSNQSITLTGQNKSNQNTGDTAPFTFSCGTLDKLPLTDNQTAILSVDYIITGDAPSGSAYFGFNTATLWEVGVIKIADISKVSKTGRIFAIIPSEKIKSTPANKIRARLDNVPITVTVEFSKPKLEIASKNSDWTPAPEDAQSQIDSLNQVTKEQGTSIKLNSDQIALKADKTVVDGINKTVQQQGTSITQNADAIKLKANQSTVDTLNSTVTKHGTLIDQNAKSIQLKADSSTVNTIKGTVDSNSAAIKLNANNIALKADKTAVDNLTDTVTSQGSSIKLNSDSIKLKADQAVVDNINKTVSSNTAAINVNTNNIKLKANQSTVDTLSGRVSTAEGKIEVQAGQIAQTVSKTELNSTLSGYATHTWTQGQIKTTADNINLSVQKVQSNIDNLSAGARNYLLNSAELLDSDISKVIDVNGNAISEPFIINNDILNGSEIVASFEAEYTGTSNGTITFQYMNVGDKGWGNLGSIALKKGKSRYIFKGISPKITDLTSVNKIRILCINVNDGHLTVTKGMYASGNVDAGWSLAPEDIATSVEFSNLEIKVNGIQGTVANKADQSQVTQLADQITSTVSNLGQRNLVYNSEVVSDLDGWELSSKLSGAALYIGSNQYDSYNGSNSVRFSRSGTTLGAWVAAYSKSIPIIAGSTYSASAILYTTGSDQPKATSVRLEIDFLDDKKARVGFSYAKFDLSKYHDKQTLKIENAAIPDGATQVVLAVQTNGDLNLMINHPMMVRAAKIGPYSPDNVSQSQITQMKDDINLRVQKGDVINQINISPESILIAGQKVHITGQTTIDNAVIKDAMISTLSASKLTAGTIDAGKINVVNLNASNITTGTITGSNLSINLNTGEIMFTKGSIKSTNGMLNINVDDGSFTQTDQIGNGVYFNHGAVNFADADFSWPDTNNDHTYGLIDSYGFDAFGNNLRGLRINGTYGVHLVSGKDNFGFTPLSTIGAGADFDPSHGAVYSEGRMYISGGNVRDAILHSSQIIVGYPLVYPGSYYDWHEDPDKGVYDTGTGMVLTSDVIQFQGTRANNIFSNSGRLTLADDAKSAYIMSMMVYSRTYSSGATMTVTQNGVFGRISSASKYKLDISTVNNITEQAHAFLAVEPKQWFDKSETEDMAKELTEGDSGSVDSANVRPYYGYVAEDLYSAGLDNVVLRDSNTGELEGIQYDRLTVYHHELIRELYQRVNDLEAKIYSMEANK